MKGVGYNSPAQARKWVRDVADSLGDFVVRIPLLHIFEEERKYFTLLDIGCGEGFMTRRVAPYAKRVFGIDKSWEMIRLANEKPQEKISYCEADALSLPFPRDLFDVAMSHFVSCYFDSEQLGQFYSEMARVLKPQGRFVVSAPHPVLYLDDYRSSGFAKVRGGKFDYQKSRNKMFSLRFPTVSGRNLDVSYCHTTLEDHFKGISRGGLVVDGFYEPVVHKKITSMWPLFKPVEGRTPFMIIRGRKK